MARAHRPLVAPAVAVAAGIAVVTSRGADALAPATCAACGIAALALTAFAAPRVRSGWRRWVWWSIVPWFFLGGEAAVRARHVPRALDVGEGGARLVAVRGVVVRSPVGRRVGRYEVELRAMGEPWRPARGLLVVDVTPPTRALARGDVVQATGFVRRFPVPRNPGGFDRRERYRRRGVVARMTGPRIERLERGSERDPLRQLDALRDALAVRADRSLSPRASALFRSLVLGDRTRLDPSITDSFRRAGVVHLLAISGLHVALLGGVVFGILRRVAVPRGIAAIVGVGVLAGYAGLAGFAPPVVRAAVLGAGMMIAPATLRKADPWNSLAGAALATLLIRPGELFSPGFALSYAAVAGILLHAGRWDIGIRVARRVPRAGRRITRSVVASLAVSAAAWCGTGPLVWAWFGVVNPWAPVATLLVAPLFVATLLAAFAVVVPGASWLVGPLFEVLAEGLVAVAAWSGSWPGSMIAVGDPGAPALWLASILVAASARRPRLVIALPVVLLAGVSLRPGLGRDHVMTLLDVGHGLAAVATDDAGDAWIYDAGSSDVPAVAERVIVPFLRDAGLTRCSGLIVSHLDRDHTSGVGSLVERRWVDRLATRADDLAGTGFEVVHPTLAARRVLGDNDGSLVVVHASRRVRVLLAGDVEAAGIFGVMRRLAAPVDVVVAPHHGGVAWNFGALLDHARPRVVLVSARRAVDARTTAACAVRGIPILSTADHGALAVRALGPRFEIVGHLGGRWRF